MKTADLWQGPRPYLERDRERFFGRTEEKDVLVEMIRRNRLVVVTAPSGVGKTSLLLAGVVPELRMLHHDELRGDAPNLVGPTLICRTWSRVTGAGPNAVLIDAIASAVADLAENGIKDEEADGKCDFVRDCGDLELQSILAMELRKLVDIAQRGQRELKDATTFVSRLGEKMERITIILDQFEDALRLSQEGAGSLLKIIARLYESDKRIRFVLSLRHEYMMQLHDLEVRIGGLAPKTYYLRSVPVGVVTEIIRGPAEGKINIDERAIETLKQWLGVPSVAPERRLAGQSDDDHTSHSEAMGSLSLLRLQALLVDIHDFMIRSGHEHDLTEQMLSEYVQKHNRGRLANDAIESYISKTVDSSLARHSAISSEQPSDHLFARLFARLAPRLTSRGQPGTPGYKIQVPLHWILEEVLKPDLGALGISSIDARILLQLKTDAANVVLKIDDPPGLALYKATSGPARSRRWSDAETARHLVCALSDLLDRLVDGNILKSLGRDDATAYELVHDGLGEPVASWSQWFQETMFDALSSLTVISGVTFRWDRDPPPNLLIDSVFWQGCFINRTTFDRTVFHACDLRGTVFAGCVFKGVTFFDCILDGAMFLGCSFSTHVSDDPCEFDGGLVGSALFADCEFGEVRFKDTVLDGSIFKKNQIHRSIDIVNSSLEVVVLLECEYVGENTAERRGVLRIAASDVFCTRIISTPFGNKRRPRVVIQSDCEVFPVGLRESFETPPNTKLSKDRIDVVKMLETKYLLPVSQDERTSHKVATPQ